MPRSCTLARVALLGLALMSLQAHAVYKCTEPKTGKVSYSDAPCPKVLTDTKMEWNPSSNTNTVGSYTGAQKRIEPNADLKIPPEGASLLDIYRRWIDAERLATSTARIAMSGPVGALQELKRKAAAASVAECMVPARSALTALITASTEAHLQFMAKEEVTSILYFGFTRDKLVREFEAATTARC